MTRFTLIWLALLSILAAYLIWIFHGSAYAVCYSPYLTTIQSFEIMNQSPTLNCFMNVFLLVFLGLFLAPVSISLIFYAVYVLIFNRKMPFTKYILWFTWLIAFYFFYFEMSLMPFT